MLDILVLLINTFMAHLIFIMMYRVLSMLKYYLPKFFTHTDTLWFLYKRASGNLSLSLCVYADMVQHRESNFNTWKVNQRSKSGTVRTQIYMLYQ